jgi:transposase-like protein
MGALVAEVIDTGEKRDGRGRRIAAAQQRRELLAVYERSELTQKAFARREGVNYHTFTYWVQQWRRARRAERTDLPAVRFAEVRLGEPAPAAKAKLTAANCAGDFGSLTGGGQLYCLGPARFPSGFARFFCRSLARRAEQLPGFHVYGTGKPLNGPQLKPWPPSGFNLLEVFVFKVSPFGQLLLGKAALQP